MIYNKHPLYEQSEMDYMLWRDTYNGGEQYLNRYLYKFSNRESQEDFQNRRAISYIPSHSTAAILEIQKALFQRMDEVVRDGGTQSYQQAISGDIYGVDRRGSGMNYFIGTKVIPELLVMGKLGVYVDMPEIEEGATLADTYNKRPYLYTYCAEDVLNWACIDYYDSLIYTSLLVRERYDEIDQKNGLTKKYATKYRYMHLLEDGVLVQYYDEKDKLISENILKLPFIPFICFDIGKGLLANICRHQIALTNLSSADMAYGMKSNFPLFTEQYNPATENVFLKQEDDKPANIDIGVNAGRRYPVGVERPGFIHPSPEPLKVSMEKQQQIIQDIRILMNLTLTSVGIRKQVESAESKKLDEIGLEAGLAAIGSILEWGEQRIAQIWSSYEKNKEYATVIYPTKYSLKSDQDRQVEALRLASLKTQTNSETYQKTIEKQIAQLALGNKVKSETMQTIFSEIDNSNVSLENPIIPGDLPNSKQNSTVIE